MLFQRMTATIAAVVLVSSGVFMPSVSAAIVDVTVTVENLAPTNSVSFAPLRLGFHNGSFDPFDVGGTATAPIISVAEGGSGSDWFPALTAADPGAVQGTVAAGGPAVPAGNAGGLLSTASGTFRVNTANNRFFSFANMVVPSNDLFLGNDTPIELLDTSGNLLLNTISQTGADIWNAGSEQAIAANAAFLVGSVNGNRVAENGVIEFAFSELTTYDGLTTAAGYTFDSSSISGATPIYRISFATSAVPEPSSFALFAMGAAGMVFVRRKRHQVAR